LDLGYLFAIAQRFEPQAPRHLPHKTVLPIRLRPKFSVFSKGFTRLADHRRVGRWPKIRPLGRFFSGADDCADLVNFLQDIETKLFSGDAI
jgi:hypothetical protein